MESEKEVTDIESLASNTNTTNVAIKSGNNRKLWIILITLTLGRDNARIYYIFYVF